MTVDRESAGLRLDVYLAQQFSSEGISRAEAQRLIVERLVTVNGHEVKASIRLKPADVIRLEKLPLRQIPLRPENLPLEILYEDASCLVVNKAAGMMVHPAAGRTTGTLVNALLYRCPDLSGIGGERRPGIVHRLDKDTSGLMVVAKTPLAFQGLARQFKERQVQKEYVALIWGKLPSESGVIDRGIGRHRSDRKRLSSRYSLGKSREAVTQWQVEKLFKLTRGTSPLWVSLLRLKPTTGRTHQLRVHLADFGFPIVGDQIYGQKKRAYEQDNAAESLFRSFPRQALHAERLSFVHPTTQNVMAFRAPLPQDMNELLKFLETEITAAEATSSERRKENFATTIRKGAKKVS
ncbi:MAG TPA: RluA family pseudouridine synthase [Candidatus Binatia bacterium]|nr:RluA family pseudouridine synthase [Candidatus Binatia bacterium]